MNDPIPTLELEEHECDANAGFGAMETSQGCFSLRAMEVRTCISTLVAKTKLRQEFQNPFEDPLEATYIFPLPDRAAVTSFQVRYGDETVVGELREREAARLRYDDAIRSGHRAAIAEEDRSGVFSIRVGNLPPRERAIVELELEGPIDFSDGEGTFRFPLVVAPRYTPGIPLDGRPVGMGTSPDTDQVPDASRVTPPILLPGIPNPVELSIEAKLELDRDVKRSHDWKDKVRCTLPTSISEDGASIAVKLTPGQRLDRDFVLRFSVGKSSEITSTIQFSRSANLKDDVFALTIVPPKISPDKNEVARNVVFVLDRSGSMKGWKIVAARRAIGRMIDTLPVEDNFHVIAFDNLTELAPVGAEGLVRATNRNRWQAIEWIGSLSARGGTHMGPALSNAIELLADAGDNEEAIVVLVTDGQVTGEDVLLRKLQRISNGRVPRVCAVGIDQALNAGFLNRLAAMGKGHCEFVESEDRLDEAMSRLHQLLHKPIITKLQLEALNFELIEASVAPSGIRDLFPGRPVLVFGRCSLNGSVPKLRVAGIDSTGAKWNDELCGQFTEDGSFLSMWGRAKVRELEDQYASGNPVNMRRLGRQIVDLSLETNVLSRFTAFVAISRSMLVGEYGGPVRIIQPVELPAGWQRGHVSNRLMMADEDMAFDESPCEYETSTCSYSMPRRDTIALDQVDIKLTRYQRKKVTRIRRLINKLEHSPWKLLCRRRLQTMGKQLLALSASLERTNVRISGELLELSRICSRLLVRVKLSTASDIRREFTLRVATRTKVHLDELLEPGGTESKSNSNDRSTFWKRRVTDARKA